LGKIESIIIKAVIYFTLPLFLFILFWWITASFRIYEVIELSESHIIIASLIGLLLGFGLLLIHRKKIINNFYHLKTFYIIAIYLFYSSIAFAFLMGLPFLNLILGVLAGIYLGRKARNTSFTDFQFKNFNQKSTIFIASITAVLGLFIGLLSLKEDYIINILNSFFHIFNIDAFGIFGILVAILYATLMFVLQYYLTSKSCQKAFKL